jgi:hypothetical protein
MPNQRLIEQIPGVRECNKKLDFIATIGLARNLLFVTVTRSTDPP